MTANEVHANKIAKTNNTVKLPYVDYSQYKT